MADDKGDTGSGDKWDALNDARKAKKERERKQTEAKKRREKRLKERGF